MCLQSKDRLFLLVSLLIGLINGLIYVSVVPPWQHSDEPTHFEYAWLLANRPGLPEPGDYDQQMRRAVAESMIEHGFFRDMGFLPEINAKNQPIYIGQYPQLADPPAYYWIISLPLRLLRGYSVDLQLYAGRLFSLAMLLLTIVAGWGVTCELTKAGHLLRLLFPSVLALLPGFVDLMTSINNDVGAVLLISFAFWGMVRLVNTGFSAGLFAVTAAVTLLAVFTKETAFMGVPALIVSLVFSIFRGKIRWLGWVALFSGMVVGMLLVFKWDDARYWGRQTFQPSSTRVQLPSTPHGEYAIEMHISPDLIGYGKPALHQMLPLQAISTIRGKTVTVGAWMWSNKPVRAVMPLLNIYEVQQKTAPEIDLGTQPGFYSYQVFVEDFATRAWVSLYPGTSENDVIVYFDDIVLAAGSYPTDISPIPGDTSGSSGNWGGQAYKNLVRNGSGESAWFHIAGWADRLGASVLPDETAPSWMGAMAFDREGAGWLFTLTYQRLFRTFWGVFGWNHVEIIGKYTYLLMGLFTAMGFIGLFGFLVLQRRLNSELVVLFIVLLICIWGAAMLRGSLYLLYYLFIPVARYVYPAVIGTMLPFVLGWWFLVDALRSRLKLPENLPAFVILAAMASINFLGLFSIYQEYSMR